MDKMTSPPSRRKYASLMSADRQKTIRNSQERSVRLASQLSGLSIASSAVSDFLGGKIEALTAKKDGLLAYKAGLFEARETKVLREKDFKAELEGVVKDLYPISRALQAFENGKRFIEQDIEQTIEDEARHAKRPRDEEPDIDFYERAYANTLVPRIMGASSKQGKRSFSKHEQADFRQAVLERYGALKKDLGQDLAWCHITSCWWPKDNVKAAHLVPKLLTGDELAFLFGVRTLVLKDPKNGLSLHTQIEIALDSGKIVVVPLPTADYATCTWKCVLVDQGIQNQAACRYGSEAILWKDLDGRELQFQTANRPARRYLYFRFLITYLHAKRSGFYEFTSTVDSRQTFWASPGGYLERSTLRSLARNISGIQLPPAITAHTFDASALASKTEDAAAIIATELQDAVVASSKRWNDKDESDEDADDEDTDDEGD